MSELTQCNCCSYREVKERYKGQKIELKLDEYGWLEVFVDKEPVGMLFKEITDHCVC